MLLRSNVLVRFPFFIHSVLLERRRGARVLTIPATAARTPGSATCSG